MGKPAVAQKSFLNHISIGGFNLGEALDPNNNLDKLANSAQSGDIGGVLDSVGDMLDDIEDRYDQASDLLEELIGNGKKDMQPQLEMIRGKRTRMRMARRKMTGMRNRLANERRMTEIESRLEAVEKGMSEE